MTFNYIKNLFPHRAKSLDEFIEIMKENYCREITTKFKIKEKLVNKEERPYVVEHQYSIVKIKMITPVGRTVVFEQKYDQKDFMEALKSTLYTIDTISAEIPKLNVRVLGVLGNEKTNTYSVIRDMVENQL